VGETVASRECPGTHAEDSTLLRGAQSGDPEALEMLCRRNWRPVFGFFARYTDSPTEAEDLTQEVFLRALRALPRFEERGLSFTPYLLTIAGNLARDRGRAGWRHVTVTPDVPEQEALVKGPDTEAVDGDRRQVLLAALDRLAPDHRAVLRLRILEGRTTGEVATLIDRSPAAVRQLQVRALGALRAALGPDLLTFRTQDTDGGREPR
jgi:RNA polymerase sigma-70 factor (ECF subfamily)